ncbi:MAG: dihydrofolate reductase family protein [Actinobacteria bacterium]|nr:dihydrofolate reductase family protein [Actinomycetota bacterium]
MNKLTFDISISLDGFCAGPDQSLEDPLGKGGRRLHEWTAATRAWRESHGLDGGETGADSELVASSIADTGATIMGRRMFSGGTGPWESDPNANGWWGETPPFHHPVFVLTHHEREPLEMQGGTTFTFVTNGIESALAQARAAAGEKDIRIGGGGSVVQQYLAAGHVDEMTVHIAPVLLGGGTRLFSDELERLVEIEMVQISESPTGVIHTLYRVAR